MKKIVVYALVFLMLVIMLVPTAAFASDGKHHKNFGIPDKAPFKITDRSDTDDTSLGVIDTSSGVMSLGTVGPTKITKSLKKYDTIYGPIYAGYTMFTAKASGFYTFHSVTNQNTEIFFYTDEDGDGIYDDDYDYDDGDPFSNWFFLEQDVTYEIDFQNWDSSSITYLMTVPTTLGTTGYTISPKGYDNYWMQGFDFEVPEDGNYSIHISCPANGWLDWTLGVGTDWIDDFEYVDSPADIMVGDFYRTFSLEAGTYHLALWLYNYTSKTNTFKISMDNSDESTSGMTVYTPYSSTLVTNDILTANYFIPVKSGDYKFPCSNRSDAKVTVSTVTEVDDEDDGGDDGDDGGDGGEALSYEDNYLLMNDSPATAVATLEAGTTYYVFYTTNGNAGTINYQADFQASHVCQLVSVEGLNFDGHVVSGTSSSSVTINPTILDNKATWALYSDKDCATEITDKTLSAAGLNKAYIKVTAEDEANFKVYPVLLYITGTTALPSIVVYDNDYNEVESGDLIKGAAHAEFLGTATLSADVNSTPYTISGSNTFTLDGSYSLDLQDGNLNSAGTFTFTIDNTVPTITAVSNSAPISSGGATCTKDVTVTVTDTHPGTNTVIKGNNTTYPWPSGGTFTEDGSYVVTATDAIGNSSTFSFTIDKTPPSVTAVLNDKAKTPVTNNGYVTQPVVVTVSGNDSIKPTVTKNSKSIGWPSSGKFSSTGTYVVTARDTANNITTFTFTIDTTKPTITVKADTKTIKNKGTAKRSVTATAADTNLNESSMTVVYNGGTAAVWTKGETFADEGTYVLSATDYSNLNTTMSFTIDLPPVLSAKADGADVKDTITTKDVHVTYSDQFMKSKTINGKKSLWPAETIPGSFDLTGDGIYTITLQDKAGNKTSVKFTIDKTAPQIKVTPYKGADLADGGITNKKYVTVKITDLTATVKSATLNGLPIAAYPKSGKFYAEGTYIITATDSASHTSTFTFTIDRTTPVIHALSDSLTVVTGSTVTHPVDLSITEANLSTIVITKDSADYYQYPRDTATWDGTGTHTLSVNGLYVITVTDKMGYSATMTFTINIPIA